MNEMIKDQVEQVSAEFKTCHQRWSDCISGMDRNTIEKQIMSIADRNAIWGVLYEARKYLPKREEGPLKSSGLLQNFIDECFWETQLAAIRRIGDASSGLDGEKGIYSLGALICDLKQNRNILTRRNLMAVAELPYDDGTRKQNHTELINCGFTGGAIPREAYPGEIQTRHETIDGYCASAPTTRKPDDIVAEVLLERWAGELKSNVSKYATKYVAHAATPESRAQLPAITLAEIVVTWQNLVKLAREIATMLNISLSTTLVYQVDPLEGMEYPLIPEDKKDILMKVFNDCTIYCKSPFSEQNEIH